MFEKFASIRSVVAVCLALCMPCQVVFAARCICTSDCPCQDNITSHSQCESQCNTSICSACACCPCDCSHQEGTPCSCKCHKLPLNGLPLSQQNTRSLSEILQFDSGFALGTSSDQLDILRQFTFADAQDIPCVVQQPCILFCRFLL